MTAPHGDEWGGLTRRRMLQGAGTTALLSWGLGSALPLRQTHAATPRTGGVARLRGYDPLGWDPLLTASNRTHIAVSFTHNRLFRYKAGPEVDIGAMIVEPDLVERWEEPDDTRYIFHLRQGVRWHARPPVNGRELVAEDVQYSIERFLTVPGNANRALLADIARVQVLGKYTLQVDLQRPNVWFLDYLAEASTLPIIAREAVDTFGSLKKPEAVIGTGPWMLASYTPKVSAIFRKNPHYFRPGLPHLDEVHLLMLDDDATAAAAYMTGQFDFAPGFYQTIRLTEYTAYKEKHPDWYYKGFRWNIHPFIAMRSDQAPFRDQRVRQAISMAINREVVQSEYLRHDTAVPASLKAWHLPLEQLGEAAQYYQYNPDAARRLLHDAGYPQGFETAMLVHTGYGPAWADYAERVAAWLRDVGIRPQLVDKPYAAYTRLLAQRQYDGMLLGLAKPYVTPDGYIYGRYGADNLSHVDDAEMRSLAESQRSEKDAGKRRAIFDRISRLAAVNQYYIHLNSWPRIASWQPYVTQFNTNLGYDYGGRLEGAWFATF